MGRRGSMMLKTTKHKTFAERAEQTNNPMAKQLLQLMATKQTNLAVNADVTQKKELLAFAELVGEEICVLKTHVDLLEDFDEQAADRDVAGFGLEDIATLDPEDLELHRDSHVATNRDAEDSRGLVQQILEAQRLGQVVGRASGQAALLLLRPRAAGEDNHRDLGGLGVGLERL